MSKVKFSVNLEMGVDELAGIITDDLSYQQVIDLIKSIDYSRQDWDFTLEVYEHFAKLYNQYTQESMEDK